MIHRMETRIVFRTLRALAFCFSVGILIASVGCGPSRPPAYPAKGRVVFPNGSSVKTGTVELKSRQHGTHARGTIEADGSFVLTTYEKDDGAVAGLHDCVVVQMILAEDAKFRLHGTYGVVHTRFASYATSGLTCTVEPKASNDIVLTVEGIGKLSTGGTEKDHKH